MGRRPSGSLPQIRNHNGYARVRWNGQDLHLGRYGSPESHVKFADIVRGWLERHPSSVTEPAKPAVPPQSAGLPVALPPSPSVESQETPSQQGRGESPDGITIVELCARAT